MQVSSPTKPVACAAAAAPAVIVHARVKAVTSSRAGRRRGCVQCSSCITTGLHRWCQGRHREALLDGMAGVAVLPDLLPVFGFMVVVVTAETAWGINVADVAGVGPELHVHVRKH